MDEDFQYFLKKFGAGFERREVPQASTERYKGKLPERLMKYWKFYGWCGYAEGLFWTVNPQDYEDVVKAFLEGTLFETRDTYHVIAKSGFGELYLWGEKTANCLKISSYFNKYFYNPKTSDIHNGPRAVSFFFAFQTPSYNDMNDLFEPALKSLGRLKHDEIYGFVPALAFGGEPTLKRLRKVKDVEHMLLLAQLQPLQHWEFPGWDLTET
ncbi:GAD-like domain-containing protein [Pseudomonas sp. DC3000-4b1]|uniref:GAD-like domain-containing protein n=1 Tax=unclassified Pseudomonas TaxID=196821 RepID=UPI003CF02124